MPSLPSLGSKAPNFSAITTFGPITLSDYKGKWVVLFSHPGDFTPVCTTEFLSFAKSYNEFKKRNVDLIGLSIDSNPSHLAWVYNMFLYTGIDIPFPIIADSSMKVAKLYGMLSDDDESTVRAVFIIDDNQILRTILYYPASTGRNIPEILRIIDGLQTSDKDHVATPANWLPGMPVILPYPKTYKELKNNFKNCNKDYSCIDWYLCFVTDSKNTLPNNKSLQLSNAPKKSKISKAKFCNMKRPPITSPTDKLVKNPNCPNLVPIVAEYTLGNPSNLDVRFLDAIIYAFVSINSDGTLSVPTPQYLKQMVSLKSVKPSLKVIAAIGGWGADGFSDAALTPKSRYDFAREVLKLINKYDLDGIDIDWEYPATSASGITAREEDKENFTLLLTAIRDVIGDDKWLSVAGIATDDYLSKSVNISDIEPLIDYFNFMSYDFTAGETGDRGRKHQANLYDSDLSLPGFSVDAGIENLIENGMDPNKILLGLPFYGRLGATITKSYDELRRSYINKNGYIYQFDDDAQVPYLIKDSEFAMSFDNEVSIFLKSQYVLENCLGGIFSWQSTFDQANILARAMFESINNPNEYEDELTSIFGNFN